MPDVHPNLPPLGSEVIISLLSIQSLLPMGTPNSIDADDRVQQCPRDQKRRLIESPPVYSPERSVGQRGPCVRPHFSEFEGLMMSTLLVDE
jgi:hypothetical protein